MELRAARQPGFGGDFGGPEFCVAAPADQIGRGFEDSRAGFLRTLGLGPSPCGAERTAS